MKYKRHYSMNKHCKCGKLITNYSNRCNLCNNKGKNYSPKTQFKKGHKVSKELKEKLRILNKGKKLSLETKIKMSKRMLNNKYRQNKKPWNKDLTKETNNIIKMASEKMQLEKHPNWLGGKSFEPYNKDFNLNIKKHIRNKYNFTCQECFINEKDLKNKLDIHHIDYNKFNSNEENLIPLCRKCHAKTNFDRLDWINHFKNKKEEKYGSSKKK